MESWNRAASDPTAGQIGRKRNQKDMSDTEIYIVAAKDFLCDQLT
jgi:hypothetical protein